MIQQIQINLKDSNQLIADLEKKDTDSYKEQLQSNLNQKQKELEAHHQNKPEVKEPPTDMKVIEKNKEVSNNIDTKRKELADLEKLINDNIGKQKIIIAIKNGT